MSMFNNAKLGEYCAVSLCLLKRHFAAIIIALGLALLVAAPLIAFPIATGNEYRGINIAHISDEYFYLTRGKEALEGHGLGQPMLAEGKDASDETFSYAERILVSPLRILGIS